MPNKDGGRENLEAIAMLQDMNSNRLWRMPRHPDGGRRNRRHFPRSPPRLMPERLGFGYKWNMGWMNDTLDYHVARAGPPQPPPSPDDLRVCIMRSRKISSCRSAMTRSCMARARFWARCPATTGSALPICAPITGSCGAIRARSFCSWGRSSASARNGTMTAQLAWHYAGDAAHAGHPCAWCAISTGFTAKRRRCTGAMQSPMASSGSMPMTREFGVSVAWVWRGAKERLRWCRNFTPVPREGLPDRVARAGAGANF